MARVSRCDHDLIAPSASSILRAIQEESHPIDILHHAAKIIGHDNLLETLCLNDVSKERELVCKFIDVFEDDLKPPRQFFCPISLTAMRNPVVASDGFTYEKDLIKRHLFANEFKSPLTRATLSTTFYADLYSNTALKTMMRDWADVRSLDIVPSVSRELSLANRLELAIFIARRREPLINWRMRDVSTQT